MPRLDRKRLDEADFSVIEDVPTRFDDMDVQGHINNVAAAAILQEARVRISRVAGVTLNTGLYTIVASLMIEYAAELYYPAPVEVCTGILTIGRTSFTIGQLARQGGPTALYAETVLVMTNGNGPIQVPDAIRAAFEAIRIG